MKKLHVLYSRECFPSINSHFLNCTAIQYSNAHTLSSWVCVLCVSDTWSVISLPVCLSAAHSGLHHAAPACVLSGISTIDLQWAFYPAPQSTSAAPPASSSASTQPVCPHTAPAPAYGECRSYINATECSFLSKLCWKKCHIFINVLGCLKIYIYTHSHTTTDTAFKRILHRHISL